MPIKDSQEFKEKLKSLLGDDETGEKSVLISDMVEFYEIKEQESTDLASSVETLKANNESLRSANMKLFQKLGGEREPDKVTPPKEVPQPKVTYKFSDFINEKGDLK